MKSTNPITDYLLHASNFLPAIVFLFYGRLGPEQPDVRWTHAFLIGGVLALVSPAGSRLWGEELGPAAMLICVLVVGIVHTAWSDGGFVDGTFAFERAFGELLSAFEFMSAAAVGCVVAAFPALRAPFAADDAACYALVEIATGMPGLDALLDERTVAMLDALANERVVLDAACAPAERFWRIRDALPVAVAQEGIPLSFDVSFPRGALAAFVADAEQWLAAAHPSLRCHAFGHFGDGGCHLVVSIPHAGAQRYGPLQQVALRGALYDRVVRAGGCFSAEHGVGPVNVAYYRKHVPASHRQVAAAVQHAIDPLGLIGRVRY